MLIKRIYESFELHQTLNSKIWEDNGKLKPEVEEKLFAIINEYISNSEVLEEKDILDALIVGSNASFNYTEDSDIDLHLVVNMESLSCDPTLVQIACNSEKAAFNSSYDLSIKGTDVELYVEDVNAGTISNGIYSLFQKSWIKFPEQIEAINYDTDPDFLRDVEEQSADINNLLSSNSTSQDLQNKIDDLYVIRKNSISQDGEYGYGNQLFKEIRNRGLLDKLKEQTKKIRSKELSLESLDRKAF